MPDDTMGNIFNHLKTLGLKRMEAALEETLAGAAKQNLSTAAVLERLLEIEAVSLTERRIERRIRESRLPERKLLADFDFKFQTGIDQRQVMELATMGFVECKQWLILAGKFGCWKEPYRKGPDAFGLSAPVPLPVCYRPSFMLRDLLSGLADDSIDDKLKTYVTPEVLLIDEIGFDRLEQESSRNASLFFKVIEGRYCKNTTILTTNVDFKVMGEYLGDPVVTAAMVDRMVHHAIIINIDGPSFRMHESKRLNQVPRRKNALDKPK